MRAPFQHILVPLDGSRPAEVVLPAALAIGAACRATVTLLHVLERDAPATVHGEHHLDDAAEAQAYLRSVAERFADSGATIDYHVHENPQNDVARSIAEHAAELHAELIAIATHGSGGLRGFLFGSIAQQTLRQTTIPIMLIRPTDRQTAPFACRTILVPIDGTPQSRVALPLAQEIASATGASLHLVRVVPTRGTVSGERSTTATFMPAATSALLDIEEQSASDDLTELRDRLGPEQSSSQVVARGEIVDELLRVVEQDDADLVVMSTHGRWGLEGLWTGSVASKFIGRLDRPVILVPIPRDSEPGAGASG
jgi:nucleotide-binding universal stress UspA family protein